MISAIKPGDILRIDVTVTRVRPDGGVVSLSRDFGGILNLRAEAASKFLLCSVIGREDEQSEVYRKSPLFSEMGNDFD